MSERRGFFRASLHKASKSAVMFCVMSVMKAVASSADTRALTRISDVDAQPSSGSEGGKKTGRRSDGHQHRGAATVPT